MAVTRSSAADRVQRGAPAAFRVPVARARERIGLICAAVIVLAAILLTIAARLDRYEASNTTPTLLSAVDRGESLLPALDVFTTPNEKQYVAKKILARMREGAVENVGALARIRVPIREVLNTRGLPTLAGRAHEALQANKEAVTISLLTPGELARMKPFLAVRTEGRFRTALLLWCGLFFIGFVGVHIFWSMRGIAVAQSVLPILLLIAGTGLTLMITLRDPVRDTLLFADFAQGVVLGCIGLAGASLLDYRKLTGGLSYTLLLAAIVLSIVLVLFGSGPGGSDAKVNLFGFQPAEVIRVLIVFFLAGYLADRWEFLRTLREQRPEVARVSRWVEVPRLEYLVPVLGGVVVSLLFFYLQRDLGPALLIACLFLAMYAVARDRYLFATAGLALIFGGFLVGYLLGFPRTVASRVSMWLSPWDNAVRGGEQVVHSLWAFATGGLTGTGLGLGDPALMPAAHTDLILAALGEEWGFVGVFAMIALYAALVWFGLRTALRARNDYNFFLALGLTLILALQILLIAGGVLDLVPLSGVVLPFLSYGRTALLTNFVVVGILVSLAREGDDDSDNTRPFFPSVRGLGIVLAAAGVIIIGKAAYVQVVRADATAGAGTLTLQADGFRRYQYNPRLLAIADSIPRGTIYDRNGLPLATSNFAELAQARDAYSKMNIVVPEAAGNEHRFYPLGARGFHLLGDLRTRANWGARNSSMAERDYMIALQGYDDRATPVEVTDPQTKKRYHTIRYDYRELLPLLRHRWQPNDPSVKRVRERDRSLHLSIDARLQVKVAELLQRQLNKLGKQKGAVVVLDSANGDLLASVSYPWPAQDPPELKGEGEDDTMLDRARYGLYPPGSSFKVVTAMAALKKDPSSINSTFDCQRLPDGRVGNFVKGWARPIRDDVKDAAPHGVLAMSKAMAVSCNAYFAQLGAYKVGAEALLETANQLGISVASPPNAKNLHSYLPQASYGQGQVVASPFQMARAAAVVADHGVMPYGRWVTDQNNDRRQAPQRILPDNLANEIGGFMRGVVTGGTGRSAASIVPIAGKTGTAEIEHHPSHAWFIGYAPYNAPANARVISFAVLIENGQYGGTASAPLAGELVTAAKQLGLLDKPQ